MKQLFALTISILILIPTAAAYADSYTTVAAPPNAIAQNLITQFTSQYGVPVQTTAPHAIAVGTPAPMPAQGAVPPCPGSCANAYLPPSSVMIKAAVGPKTGNAILQNLPTLFVLDSLFKNSSNGVLTPGPTSLSDVLILYQIFFAPIPRY